MFVAARVRVTLKKRCNMAQPRGELRGIESVNPRIANHGRRRQCATPRDRPGDHGRIRRRRRARRGLGAPRRALFADGGDETRRVVFTSVDGATVTPRWVGVLFGERTDTARSGLRYTRIEGAGARATGDFVTCQRCDGERLEPNGMVFFQGVRAAGLLTQTEFRRGPRAGVAVFVAGDSAVAAEDFTASSRGNIFVLAGVRCAQSAAPTGGRCPPTPRCDGGNSQAPTASTPASASASAAAASASARQR